MSNAPYESTGKSPFDLSRWRYGGFFPLKITKKCILFVDLRSSSLPVVNLKKGQTTKVKVSLTTLAVLLPPFCLKFLDFRIANGHFSFKSVIAKKNIPYAPWVWNIFTYIYHNFIPYTEPKWAWYLHGGFSTVLENIQNSTLKLMLLLGNLPIFDFYMPPGSNNLNG